MVLESLHALRPVRHGLALAALALAVPAAAQTPEPPRPEQLAIRTFLAATAEANASPVSYMWLGAQPGPISRARFFHLIAPCRVAGESYNIMVGNSGWAGNRPAVDTYDNFSVEFSCPGPGGAPVTMVARFAMAGTSIYAVSLDPNSPTEAH